MIKYTYKDNKCGMPMKVPSTRYVILLCDRSLKCELWSVSTVTQLYTLKLLTSNSALDSSVSIYESLDMMKK